MKEKIAFIGFGRFGQALASVLRQKDAYEIAAFDVEDSGDKCQLASASEALEGASVIFLVVPSAAFRSCIEKLSPPNVPLVTCSKGIDPASKKLPIEVLREVFPGNPAVVLSGPMLSEELVAGLPASGTLGSSDSSAAKKVKGLFKGTSVSLETSKDEIGVSWCGVLKNVYALALGLCDGLELGDNFKSVLAKDALKEIGQIIKIAGGKSNSVMSYAGIGDFLATGYSSKSRNYSYGFALGQGGELSDALAEGVKNLENVEAIVGGKARLKLFSAVKAIFSEDAPPRETLLAFHK